MKNQKAIFFLFLANTVSGIAQGISMIAIPWHFTSVLGIPAFFGVLYASITFLSLFWGLLAGSIIDTYNRKRIFMALCATGSIILLSVSISGYMAGGIHYYLAALVFATTYFVYSIHYPNLYAFAQEITEPHQYGKITSYIEIQGQMTNMLGGGMAALLLAGPDLGSLELFGTDLNWPFTIQKWDLHEIFMLDGITYVLAFVLISMMKYQRIAGKEKEEGSIMVRIQYGLNYLMQHKIIFLFGVSTFAVFVTVLVIGFYIAPIYINNHLGGGAGVYAISDGFFAFGAILAGIGIHWVLKKTHSVVAIITMSLLTAGFYFYFIENTNILIFFIGLFFIGMSNAGIRILRMTWLFENIPNNVIGRTGSVFGMTNVLFRLILISLFTAPFFTNENNVIYTFLIMGAFILCSIIPQLLYYKKLIRS